MDGLDGWRRRIELYALRFALGSTMQWSTVAAYDASSSVFWCDAVYGSSLLLAPLGSPSSGPGLAWPCPPSPSLFLLIDRLESCAVDLHLLPHHPSSILSPFRLDSTNSTSSLLSSPYHQYRRPDPYTFASSSPSPSTRSSRCTITLHHRTLQTALLSQTSLLLRCKELSS